jgi:di/tripeptidase
MENKKLTEEQLKRINEVQQGYQALVQELGQVEVQKLALDARRQAAEDYLKTLQQEEKTIAEEIEKEYGKVSIDLNTGELTSMEGEVSAE